MYREIIKNNTLQAYLDSLPEANRTSRPKRSPNEGRLYPPGSYQNLQALSASLLHCLSLGLDEINATLSTRRWTTTSKAYDPDSEVEPVDGRHFLL